MFKFYYLLIHLIFLFKKKNDFICSLDPALLRCRDITDFRTRLRVCVFFELTRMWQDCTHAPLCHVLHLRWVPRRWGRLIFSRRTISLYHQVAVGRGKFGDRRIYSKRRRNCNTFCTRGCNVVETVQHVFFECPHHFSDTRALRDLCREKRVDYDMISLFSHPGIQTRTEMFLGIFSTMMIFSFCVSAPVRLFFFLFFCLARLEAPFGLLLYKK